MLKISQYVVLYCVCFSPPIQTNVIFFHFVSYACVWSLSSENIHFFDHVEKKSCHVFRCMFFFGSLVCFQIQYLKLLFLFSFWSIFYCAIVSSEMKYDFFLPTVGIKQKKIIFFFFIFVDFPSIILHGQFQTMNLFTSPIIRARKTEKKLTDTRMNC